MTKKCKLCGETMRALVKEKAESLTLNEKLMKQEQLKTRVENFRIHFRKELT